MAKVQVDSYFFLFLLDFLIMMIGRYRSNVYVPRNISHEHNYTSKFNNEFENKINDDCDCVAISC